jgi:HlyD family secretion protein
MRAIAWVLAALLQGCSVSDAASSSSPSPELATVVRGDLPITVEVSGAVQAVDAMRVGPPSIPELWNYQIQMMAPEGEVVQKGAPVLAFDASELKRRLDTWTADRDSAATQLELQRAASKVARQDEALAVAEARAELRKAELKADAPEGLTAVIELEKARLDLKLAQQKVDYLERKAVSSQKRSQAEISRWRHKHDRSAQRVRELETAIAQLTVGAPRTGTVIYTTNWQGEKKKVGDNAWRAESVLQIVSLEEMEARGQVDEVDVAKVKVGQSVSLRLDAQADLELHGRVRDLGHGVQRASPETPLKVVMVDIELQANADAKLRPGMRFRGRIETGREEAVLLVPLDAIFPTDDGPVAYRERGDSLERVPVVLGARGGEQVVVTDGLEEGDEIARRPQEDPS